MKENTKFEVKTESKVVEQQKEVSMDLEIVELEEKVAPRNWNVYAIVYQ